MGYTLTIEPMNDPPGFCRVVVVFGNGFRAETTVKGSEEQARWYAERAFIPDLRRLYPELRGDEV